MRGDHPALAIRAAVRADAAAIAAVYAPYVTETSVSFETVPPSAGDMWLRMSAEPRLPWLVATVDGAVAGYSYAAPHRARPAYRWSVDVSFYVGRPLHGRGIGTALGEELLARLRVLGYVAAFAGIALPNPASIALHERLGFTPVGVYRSVGFKRGAWHDVGWWQRLLREPPQDPAEPAHWMPPVEE